MPKIIIDDREIEVESGTKVIEAAEQLGIMIPRFCYHPALGSVGACRVCAVKFLQGPFKGIQMSCMVDAQDGMVVSTSDKDAMEFRKYVIEWLMLHHPHDCPVCDEGGHCLLQDMTVSGGHGIRRYLGKKRTYQDQYLGPLIHHEMNRCIHCYRCVRFYQEFSGYHDLGAMQSGNRTYFGRYKDGILENPFGGNITDICPTGVFTDKPSRFFGRRWDYERSPSVCINCSLGCHTVASSRYREVVRQEARFSQAVNGYFICDRGRYGFFYASQLERPHRARIDGEEVNFDQAVLALNARLAEIAEDNGRGAIACTGSWRNSLETQAMLKQLCRKNGWPSPSFLLDQTMIQKVKFAISRLEPNLAVSLREIESADFILVVGADPINEAPMLAPAMRQALRRGCEIAVVDPRPIFLPFDFTHLPAGLAEINTCLSLLIKTAVDSDCVRDLDSAASEFYETIPDMQRVSTVLQEQITILAAKLKTCERPIIVCGTELVDLNTPTLAADHALLLQAAKKQAGLFYVMPGANAFGAGLLSEENDSFEKIIENIEDGLIKGLLVIESNPFWHQPDHSRLEQALERLDLLVVLDYVSSAIAQRANIFLPTTTVFETGSTFINQEGRVQFVPKAFAGGISIDQTAHGDHPPRIYGGGIPGAEPKPAWLALAALTGIDPHLDEDRLQAHLWNWLVDTLPGFEDIPAVENLPDDGVRIISGEGISKRFSVEWLKNGHNIEDGLEIIAVDWTFGTEELSAYSSCLREVEKDPCMFMHPEDAEDFALNDADKVSVQLARGAVEVKVCIAANMVRGILVMPRHKNLAWQKFGTGKRFVQKDQIRKV